MTALLLSAQAAPPSERQSDELLNLEQDATDERILTERGPPLTLRDPHEACVSLPDAASSNAFSAVFGDGKGPAECIPADVNDGVIWDLTLDDLRVGAIITVRESSAWADAKREYWVFDAIPAELDWGVSAGGVGPGSVKATALEWDDIGMGGPTDDLLIDICLWQQSVGATEWEIDRDSYTGTSLSTNAPPSTTTISVPSNARMLEVFQHNSTAYYLWLDMFTNPSTPEVRWYDVKSGSQASNGAFTSLRPGDVSDVNDASIDLALGPAFDVYEETSTSVSPTTSFCQNFLGPPVAL
jgi:hypothetical protein